MAPIVPSKKSWTADITPYLLYLLAISTLGPLQFGFHLVSHIDPLSPPFPITINSNNVARPNLTPPEMPFVA